ASVRRASAATSVTVPPVVPSAHSGPPVAGVHDSGCPRNTPVAPPTPTTTWSGGRLTSVISLRSVLAPVVRANVDSTHHVDVEPRVTASRNAARADGSVFGGSCGRGRRSTELELWQPASRSTSSTTSTVTAGTGARRTRRHDHDM